MNVTFLIVYLKISNGLLRSLDLLIFSDLILFYLFLIVTINQLSSYDIYYDTSVSNLPSYFSDSFFSPLGSNFFFHSLRMGSLSLLVFYYYCYQLSQTYWLQTIQIYLFFSLEVRILRWFFWVKSWFKHLSRAVLEALGEESFPCLFQHLEATYMPVP